MWMIEICIVVEVGLNLFKRIVMFGVWCDEGNSLWICLWYFLKIKNVNFILLYLKLYYCYKFNV